MFLNTTYIDSDMLCKEMDVAQMEQDMLHIKSNIDTAHRI